MRRNFVIPYSKDNTVSASDAKAMESYRIKGTAEYITEGEVVDTFKKVVSDIFKGDLIITPEKVIVTTPRPDNKKELY